MIVTWRSGLLLGTLILLFVLVQNTFFSQVEVAGTDLWILPVMVVVFGLLCGSLLGATVGFATGLLSDASGASPLGLACLTLMAVGYLGGIYRERNGRVGQRPVIIAAAAAVLGANLAFGAFGALTGLETSLTFDAVRDLLLQTVYGALFALPVYALIYRVLRPALILGPAAPAGPGVNAALSGAGREAEDET